MKTSMRYNKQGNHIKNSIKYYFIELKVKLILELKDRELINKRTSKLTVVKISCIA